MQTVSPPGQIGGEYHPMFFVVNQLIKQEIVAFSAELQLFDYNTSFEDMFLASCLITEIESV